MASSSKVTEEDWKYPQAELNKDGLLEVSKEPNHKIYWTEYGNPNGEPVIVIHGGPGGGSNPKYSRYFDPERYRIIQFDQRGCGKSEPQTATHPEEALTNNTTQDSIADMIKLREHLGINGKMHVFGGSWGSTLGMAYAMEHPETVQSLDLRGIFLCRKKDLDYFYQGNAAEHDEKGQNSTIPGAYQVFPEYWDQFVEAIPKEKRGDMVKAYADIFAMKPQNQEEQEMQDKAAIAWTVWEGATSYLAQETDLSRYQDPSFAKTFAKIENHYFVNGVFLGDKGRDQNYLLENVDKIKDIPINIVHGRYDQVCPLFQAEELVAALDKVGAKEVNYTITNAGHSMFERENAAVLTQFMDEMPKMTLAELGPKSPFDRGAGNSTGTDQLQA